MLRHFGGWFFYISYVVCYSLNVNFLLGPVFFAESWSKKISEKTLSLLQNEQQKPVKIYVSKNDEFWLDPFLVMYGRINLHFKTLKGSMHQSQNATFSAHWWMKHSPVGMLRLLNFSRLLWVKDQLLVIFKPNILPLEVNHQINDADLISA